MGLVLVLTLNGGSFVLGNGRFSLHEIARHDQILSQQLSYVRAHFAPSETVVVAQANYQHAAHYLPEYPAVYLPQTREAIRLVVARTGARWVVLLGDEGHVRERSRVVRVMLPNDVQLRVIRLRSGELMVAQSEVLHLAGE
jgi:hypothetical protein